jgi:hypothetical protein
MTVEASAATIGLQHGITDYSGPRQFGFPTIRHLLRDFGNDDSELDVYNNSGL